MRAREFTQRLSQGVAEGNIKLFTDPDYFGAEVNDEGFDKLPIVNIPTKNLVGFEPDSKMQEPKSKDNVKKILAGLAKGDNIPPILVRKHENGYQVLDGHHRFWAYKVAKKDTIPARVVDPKDIEEISKQGVAEGFPQPGESSGKAKQFNPNAKIQTREMTLDQILSLVKGIPYVNNVVDDWDAKDYSWGVTKKVIEYAQYLQKNPQSVANLPPLVVIDGKLNDGAHRLSAINLLQKRMDPKNPLWKQVKLKVNFGTSADVAEGAMKDLDIDIQDQQWDAIVGYVVNGVKKGMDTDRMELALYKWASRELVDVEQALEDHGFRDIADLADHIEQHNGRYVPPSDFGLGNLGRGVAEHNLQELGTTQYKVTEPRDMVNVDFRTKQITYKVFKFKVDKQVFLIVLTVKDQAMPGAKKKVPTLNVAFGRQDKNGWDIDDIDTNLTGDNQNQFQIYSTVVKTIQKFITQLNPNVAQIIIKGDNERQQMTYEKFFKSRYLEKYLPGFSYDPKSRTLIRNGIKSEPEQIEVKTQKQRK